MDTYRWSDSGKELLLAFEILIKYYGGNDKLAKEIQKEEILNTNQNSPYWTSLQESFLMDNHYKYSDEEMSLILKRSPGAIAFKIKTLRQSGKFQTNYGFNK